MTFIYTLATFRTPKDRTLLLKDQSPNTVRYFLLKKCLETGFSLCSSHGNLGREDVVRQGHTRHALHIWASVTRLPSLSPVPLPHKQLSFPQKLGLPAPLGRRKQSLLSLQIQECDEVEDTPEIMNSSSSTGTAEPELI